MASVALKQVHDRGGMTHMPFLAPRKQKNRILFFCKADQPKLWKLYCEDESGIHRVETGLSDDTVECSPTAWLDDAGWHVSFVGGNTAADRRYYLYRMDGPALNSLAPAIIVIKTGAGFIHQNRMVYTREGAVFIVDDQKEVRTINFPHHRIYRVSYQPDAIDKLIITAHDVQLNKIYVIEHDLLTNDENTIESDGSAAYKCAILGSELIYADRFGGDFEDRRLKTGGSIDRKFIRKLRTVSTERNPETTPIGIERFAICKLCAQSKDAAFECGHHVGCCFGQWRSQPENECPEGKW